MTNVVCKCMDIFIDKDYYDGMLLIKQLENRRLLISITELMPQYLYSCPNQRHRFPTPYVKFVVIGGIAHNLTITVYTLFHNNNTMQANIHFLKCIRKRKPHHQFLITASTYKCLNHTCHIQVSHS